ncbi:hypothetical protein BC939DRAFT_498772 [Gamsiella multidivaricata]|uniref:uncharacterized protein n=1 Tax=Gamsiella multidivaricata TaxID=101098 RepID=UPI00221F81AB|nr:uncharacterized protein BC939DRAFT_498772 [Gamsiella multidivaricata]KAI7831810.1 hypothetical protein BC939DRAFT_498772 [Gamsiella multidivaricata]
MPHNTSKRPVPQEPEQQGAIADCLSGSAPFRYAAVLSAEAPEATSPASVRDNGSDDDDHTNNNSDDNGDNDDSSDGGDDDNDPAGPTTGAVAIAASRHITKISRVERASQVVQNAQLDKNGRNTIHVPPSLSTMENYMKALTFLWK